MRMRHVWIRGIIGLIFLVAAAISGMSGKLEIMGFYMILGGMFLFSAYDTRKKSGRGGE